MCWQGYCSWKKTLWCGMYFSVKKVVTASWQINIFPSVFSAPHLPPVVGFGVWVFCCCCAGYSNTSSQKEQAPVCKCFESQFSEQYQKKPCHESLQTCYIFFCCSASLLCILSNVCEVLGKWFLHRCRPSQFSFVLLTTWSTIWTSKVLASHERGLEAGWLSAKQRDNQMRMRTD